MSNSICSALQALEQISLSLPHMVAEQSARCLEDFYEAIPLARYFGQSGDIVPQTSAAINEDIMEVENLLREGRKVAARLHRELVRVALNLWTDLCVHAPYLLHPEPGVRGTAQRQIIHAARVSTNQARVLVQEAEADLGPATCRLEEIATRQCDSVIGSREVISSRQATTQPASFSPDCDTPTNQLASSEYSRVQGERAVAAARSQIGTPYQWGGTSPSGFDCSGLTQWSYKQAGVDIPRTAHAQAVGRKVSAEELQPGDLVVWEGHVAMYSGNGMMIEAGDPVQENPLRTNNMGMRFLGFYRPTEGYTPAHGI